MSFSSDRTLFRRTLVQLKNASSLAQKRIGNTRYPEFRSVFDASTYTNFAQYNLESTVQNTKLAHSRLIPSGRQEIFKMTPNISTCPTFIMCKNTNTRPNRVANTMSVPLTTNRLASPKYSANKIYTPTKCIFVKGYVRRSCLCSKLMCKCGTKVCEQPTTRQSMTAYDDLTFRM